MGNAMCGIAGLFLKDSAMERDIGALLSGMLVSLTDRGPDSAGFAIYGACLEGCIKRTLRVAQIADTKAAIERLSTALGAEVAHRVHDTHVVVAVRLQLEMAIRAALRDIPSLAIVA